MSDSLHSILLKSVHLKHLFACYSHIQAENIDISNHRLRADNTSIKDSQAWACRRLETLHIRIHYFERTDHKHSILKVFGYLTRVCPFLNDLHIHLNDVDLSQGLCLLSRLQYLKRLYIWVTSSPYISKSNMEWLSPYMTTVEKIKYSTSMWLHGPSTNPISNSTIPRLEWEHFGDKEDIISCNKERYFALQNGVPPLPQLEYLYIFQDPINPQDTTARDAESYTRSIRPTVCVHMNSAWLKSCQSPSVVYF